MAQCDPVQPSVTQCVNSPSTRQARPGRVTSVTSHVPRLTPSWAPHFYTSLSHYLFTSSSTLRSNVFYGEVLVLALMYLSHLSHIDVRVVADVSLVFTPGPELRNLENSINVAWRLG